MSMEIEPGAARLVRDLLSSKNAEAFLESLVTTQLAYLKAVGAAIYTIDDDGLLSLRYQFGLSGEHHSPGSQESIWIDSATTEALRSNSILIYQSLSEYSKDFPDLAEYYDFSQVAVIPIWAREVPVGLLVFAFNSDSGRIPEKADSLWEVYQLLGMVLLSPPSWLYSLSSEIGISPEETFELPATVALSDAESRVLRLMSFGYTNKQIATELNYSISYIGKVNMALFQKLGAQKRREAVQIGLAKGLIHRSESSSLIQEVGN